MNEATKQEKVVEVIAEDVESSEDNGTEVIKTVARATTVGIGTALRGVKHGAVAVVMGTGKGGEVVGKGTVGVFKHIGNGVTGGIGEGIRRLKSEKKSDEVESEAPASA